MVHFFMIIEIFLIVDYAKPGVARYGGSVRPAKACNTVTFRIYFVGVHGVKKLTPPPLLTFNACLKYLLGLLPRTKNADPRLLGVKKQPPRLLILLALKPCWFIILDQLVLS